ncbi:hypothetical protein AB0D08_00590 [Kitasatospora sp. NPDC048540]|uniref:hypothetical protein n=1 Tax=Kitasatospora sp. NPDC048540 TaxID=3155634 RepID=UPI0033DCB6A3
MLADLLYDKWGQEYDEAAEVLESLIEAVVREIAADVRAEFPDAGERIAQHIEKYRAKEYET